MKIQIDKSLLVSFLYFFHIRIVCTIDGTSSHMYKCTKDRWLIRNSTMSLTALVLCFFISQICFSDHKYVFHLGKVFFHLVEVIFNLFASMFLTLCQHLSNFRTSSHVPREMSHMASLVYSKILDFCIFFVLYCTLFKFIVVYSKCPKCHTCFFSFCLILLVSTVWKSLSCPFSHFVFLPYQFPNNSII